MTGSAAVNSSTNDEVQSNPVIVDSKGPVKTVHYIRGPLYPTSVLKLDFLPLL